jgi:DNA modification methylase
MKQEFKNTLYTGDNLYILHGLNSNLVDLIYLDPPFNTKRLYAAPVGSKAAGASFKDMWTWKDVDEYYLSTLATHFPFLARYITDVDTIHSKAMMAYLTYMAQRIIEMYRVLKESGSLYLHCDPTASHYLKVLLDCIFNKNRFNNEIIWRYQTGGISKKRFAKKHDIIFWYTKTKDYIFCPEAVRIARTEEVLRRIKSGIKGATRAITLDKYADDVFEIQALNAQAKERTGYPTQKPLALLHRIIKVSSNPRHCEQSNIFTRATRINPRKHTSDFSYLTASRRFSFSFPKTRSITPRFLYSTSSYSTASFRLRLPGITALLFPDQSTRRNRSLSKPRSPTTGTPTMSAVSSSATVMSFTSPPVKKPSTTCPRSVTARCTFVVIPARLFPFVCCPLFVHPPAGGLSSSCCRLSPPQTLPLPAPAGPAELSPTAPAPTPA